MLRLRCHVFMKLGRFYRRLGRWLWASAVFNHALAILAADAQTAVRSSHELCVKLRSQLHNQLGVVLLQQGQVNDSQECHSKQERLLAQAAAETPKADYRQELAATEVCIAHAILARATTARHFDTAINDHLLVALDHLRGLYAEQYHPDVAHVLLALGGAYGRLALVHQGADTTSATAAAGRCLHILRLAAHISGHTLTEQHGLTRHSRELLAHYQRRLLAVAEPSSGSHSNVQQSAPVLSRRYQWIFATPEASFEQAYAALADR